MIRFTPAPEPKDFQEKVREPGERWLAKRGPKGRPPKLWNRVLPELQAAFRELCAYSAVHLFSSGAVDHFQPLSRPAGRRLAYEWRNYRYAAHWVNSLKRDLPPEKVLDPFEVEDGWFEVLLPSCQLVMTDACPPERREAARTMLEALKLGHGQRAVKARLAWLDEYRNGHASFSMLQRMAPLVARAVRKEERRRQRRRRAAKARKAQRSKPRAAPRGRKRRAVRR